MNLYSDILKTSAAVAAAVGTTKAPEAPPHQAPAAAIIPGVMLDDAGTGPALAITDEMRQDAVRVVQEWAETDTLDESEGYGDRLLALVVGTSAEGDKDLNDEEAEYAGVIAELVGDYLDGKGIPGDDVDLLISNFAFDNDVAERVHEALLDKLPQGEDEMLDDAGRFVDGEDDADMLDATYRKTIAVRGGKKVRINKRIAGKVRLTAGQKMAVRKMQRKAFTGMAKMKRAKSMRLRKKMGL